MYFEIGPAGFVIVNDRITSFVDTKSLLLRVYAIVTSNLTEVQSMCSTLAESGIQFTDYSL